MARGVNKVIIIGNVGKDPEAKYFPDGGAITNLTIATSESWTDKQSGEKKERTEWHNVSFNGKLAEIAAKYIRKGSKVYVEGSLRTRKWEKDGVDRYTTEIMVRDLQLLDGKPADGNGQQDRESQASSRTGPTGRPSSTPPAHRQPPPPRDDSGFEDDDIPF